MGNRFAYLIAFAFALSTPCLALAQSQFGTLSFSPENPTTEDIVVVTLHPSPGEPDWCAFQMRFPASNVVFLDTYSSPCPPGGGTTNEWSIGKLRAGSYTVVWGFHDNFNNVPVPTAALTVQAASDGVPILSTIGVLLLVAAVASIGITVEGRRRSAAG